MQAASGHRSLFVALVVSALSLASGEQSQAQLFIDVYQSQDSTNQTLWVFSGTSRSGVTINNIGTYIRRSGSYNL